MRKIVLLFALFIICFACKQVKTTKSVEKQSIQKIVKKQSEEQNEEIEKNLVVFYKKYMIAQDKEDANQINILKMKYLTKNLLDKINGGYYDYDPILNAQDVDANNIKTIKVFKDGDFYKVCYMWTYKTQDIFKDEKICIKLDVIKTKKGIKIKDIIE